MQAVQRIEREKRMDGGKKEEADDPHTSAAKRNCSLRSGLLALALLPVFDTTSPGKGGGWNRAGARHGSFTPPRFSRSCVQEYHCKLTRSWRSSLPKLHLTWVGIALHLPLAVLICGSCSAQVVLAHPV